MSPYTIKTYPSQVTWDLLYPNPDSVVLGDVAWALANGAVRFNGHIRGGYSVAQHSVLVHDILDQGEDVVLPHLAHTDPVQVHPVDMRTRDEEGTLTKELAFHALFHDAHEAYLGDLIGPLKNLLRELGAPFGLSSPWDMLEGRHDQAIFAALGMGDYWNGRGQWLGAYRRLWSEAVHAADKEAYRREAKALRSYGTREDLELLPDGRILDTLDAANLWLERVRIHMAEVKPLVRNEQGNIVGGELPKSRRVHPPEDGK